MLDRFRRKKAVSTPAEKDVESDTSSAAAGAAPVTKRAKVKRHCVRFWWIYLIALIIAVLVIVLPVVYVAYPRLIRKFARNPEYTVKSITILNPKPNSITINSTAEIPSSGGSQLKAKVDAFNITAIPKGTSIPLWKVLIPPLVINSKTVDVQTFIPLDDPKPMEDFTNTILGGGNLTVDLAGNMTIKYGALPTVHAPLTSEYTLSGAGGLNQLSLSNMRGFDFRLSPLPDGAIVVANLSIDNPSVLSVDMGNVTFDMHVDNQKVATLLLPDFFYQRGSHNYTVHVIARFIAFQDLIKRKCGKLDITFSNGTSTYGGVNIPYYTFALQKINQTSSLDINKLIKPVFVNVILPDRCKNQTMASMT